MVQYVPRVGIGRLVVPILLLTGLALAGCTGGRTRLQGPAASIQQLTVQSDGSWVVVLRLQNYSYDTSMHVFGVEATLSVDGEPAGHLSASAALDIPAMDADTVSARLHPDAAGRAALAAAKPGAVAYAIKGTLSAGKDRRDNPQSFKLDGKGFISPVPGVSNLWR